MERIVSHGHSIKTFMAFAEDFITDEELRDYQTYFNYLVSDSCFHDYIIRMLAILQEHRAVEDDDEYQQFYELKEWDEQCHINSIRDYLPEGFYFYFIEMYHFAETLLEYLDEEGDMEEVWNNTVKSISLDRDRLTVVLF